MTDEYSTVNEHDLGGVTINIVFYKHIRYDAHVCSRRTLGKKYRALVQLFALCELIYESVSHL